MEKIDLRGLEEILGIYSPWSIKSAKPNESARVIDVQLELGDRMRLFGLLVQPRAAEAGTPGSWQYISLGRYRVVIHAHVPVATGQAAALNYSALNQVCFLGSPDRNYSNWLRQRIADCHFKGLNPAQIADLHGLAPQLVATVLEDLSAVSTQVQSLACLPTELDPMWEAVLRGEASLNTQILPLKFLLSKLQLAVSVTKRPVEVLACALELRKFFIANASILGAELTQIFGPKTAPGVNSQNGQNGQEPTAKLILPGLINPVWQELLIGKIQLNSTSVALNLLVARQKALYQKAQHSRDKLTAVEIVRDYFHKNYRSLRPELLLLNRACAIYDKTKYRLPDADHSIWQQILQDDSFIPSNHVAYKLLLTRLRSQLRQEASSTNKLDAAQRIREFIKQNHKSMKQELVYLIKQTANAA